MTTNINSIVYLFLLGIICCQNGTVQDELTATAHYKSIEQYELNTAIDVLFNLRSQTIDQFNIIENRNVVVDSVDDPIIFKLIDSLKIRSQEFHENIYIEQGELAFRDPTVLTQFQNYLDQQFVNSLPIYSYRAQPFLSTNKETGKNIYLAMYLINLSLLEQEVLTDLKYSLGGNKNCFSFQ